MKKAIAVVAIAGALFLVWQVWAKYGARREEARDAQAKREVGYEEQLDRFQDDVPLGMHRADLKSYLDSKKVSYSQMTPTWP
ncbi:MAG: hypothetical protein WB660_13760 [Candidatus Sulfotelmatobacter sp.]